MVELGGGNVKKSIWLAETANAVGKRGFDLTIAGIIAILITD